MMAKNQLTPNSGNDRKQELNLPPPPHDTTWINPSQFFAPLFPPPPTNYSLQNLLTRSSLRLVSHLMPNRIGDLYGSHSTLASNVHQTVTVVLQPQQCRLAGTPPGKKRRVLICGSAGRAGWKTVKELKRLCMSEYFKWTTNNFTSKTPLSNNPDPLMFPLELLCCRWTAITRTSNCFWICVIIISKRFATRQRPQRRCWTPECNNYTTIFTSGSAVCSPNHKSTLLGRLQSDD